MARPQSLPVELQKYRVSSPFGPRKNPGNPNHIGCDWATPIGVPLEAIIAGKVSAVGGSLTHGWGYFVHVKDGEGNEVEYHILRDKPKFKVGDPIRLGQIIGHTGDSGSLRGKRYDPHHHLGCKDGDWYYDPLLIGWPGTAGNGSTPFEEDDMTPDQDRKLNFLYAAIAGPANVGAETATWKKPNGEPVGVARYGLFDVAIALQGSVAKNAGELAAIKSAVSQLSAGAGVTLDMAAIEAAAEKGAREALDGVTFEVKA